MVTTIEDLEKRVAALEQEMAAWRQQLLPLWNGEETPAERGARLLREARADQAVIDAVVAKAFAEMGITGEPIGAEKVQEMIAACGFRPEDNAFSRGIIAMREE